MQRGFSFIELIVVISIILIAAALAVPRLGNSIAVRELEDAAQQLATDIRWTQQMVVNSDSNNLPILMFSNAVPYGYTITQGTKIMKKHDFPASVNLTGNPGNLIFKINGIPASGSDFTISLRSTGINQARKVVIAMSTGRVRVEKSP